MKHDMGKGDLLEAVLDRTQAVVAGVPDGTAGDPTPCTEWDVGQLTRHMVGWVTTFERIVATGAMPPGEPNDVEVHDAAAQYPAAAGPLVRAWGAGPGPAR